MHEQGCLSNWKSRARLFQSLSVSLSRLSAWHNWLYRDSFSCTCKIEKVVANFSKSFVVSWKPVTNMGKHEKIGLALDFSWLVDNVAGFALIGWNITRCLSPSKLILAPDVIPKVSTSQTELKPMVDVLLSLARYFFSLWRRPSGRFGTQRRARRNKIVLNILNICHFFSDQQEL